MVTYMYTNKDSLLVYMYVTMVIHSNLVEYLDRPYVHTTATMGSNRPKVSIVYMYMKS